MRTSSEKRKTRASSALAASRQQSAQRSEVPATRNLSWLARRDREWACPSEPRRRCQWLHHGRDPQWSAEYKVVTRELRVRASPPRIVFSLCWLKGRRDYAWRYSTCVSGCTLIRGSNTHLSRGQLRECGAPALLSLTEHALIQGEIGAIRAAGEGG